MGSTSNNLVAVFGAKKRNAASAPSSGSSTPRSPQPSSSASHLHPPEEFDAKRDQKEANDDDDGPREEATAQGAVVAACLKSTSTAAEADGFCTTTPSATSSSALPGRRQGVIAAVQNGNVLASSKSDTTTILWRNDPYHPLRSQVVEGEAPWQLPQGHYHLAACGPSSLVVEQLQLRQQQQQHTPRVSSSNNTAPSPRIRWCDLDDDESGTDDPYLLHSQQQDAPHAQASFPALPEGTLHEATLKGNVDFVPFPQTAEDQLDGIEFQQRQRLRTQALHSGVGFGHPTISDLHNSQTVQPPNDVRLFIGQLPYAVDPNRVHWLAAIFGEGTALTDFEHITKRPRHGGKPLATGCVHASCDPQSLDALVKGLHKRVLIDETGVWYARDHQQAALLESYVQVMKADKSKRFQNRPYDTVVVQVATSAFGTTAEFADEENKKAGQPVQQQQQSKRPHQHHSNESAPAAPQPRAFDNNSCASGRLPLHPPTPRSHWKRQQHLSLQDQVLFTPAQSNRGVEGW